VSAAPLSAEHRCCPGYDGSQPEQDVDADNGEEHRIGRWNWNAEDDSHA
jgi:hypothetical protein